MSEQKTINNEQPNRREAYKSQKLQQINEIYYCQCGKNYLTFSALYLHARNKHEVKLTTKRSESICKIEKKAQKTIVTYFIHPFQAQKQNKQQQNNSYQLFQNSMEKNHPFDTMIEVVDLYLHQSINTVSLELNTNYQVVSQFKKYLEGLEALNDDDMPVQPSCIPFYFNQFVMYYLPKCHREGIITLSTLALAETSMIKLWRWLKQNKYTSSQLLYQNTSPMLK